ncbi:MAG: glycosyltransferase [Pseudomonadota bacterium]|jgi:glycosyltransferase involved in cell wall biosynthesis
MLDSHLTSKLSLKKGEVRVLPSADGRFLEGEGSQQRVPIIDGVPVFLGLKDPPIDSVYHFDVSVLIMTLNEGQSIAEIVEQVGKELQQAGKRYEIVVVDGGSSDDTVAQASSAGARVVVQRSRGYAAGLIEGFREVSGRFVITLDGDCSHDPRLIGKLLETARPGAIVVGSRWIKGGSFAGPFHRGLLSRVLSFVFSGVLRIPVADISSGYRLYASEILTPSRYSSQDFSILVEILIRAKNDGYEITEVPLKYKQRKFGISNAKLFRFAMSYLATLKSMWLLRHDANGADYDNRAYNSLNIVQRWWQRARYRKIRRLLGKYRDTGEVLDVGCGSSKIIQSLPHATAFDASLKKLRFLATTNPKRVCGSALELPFANSSFDCVIHSQLIEHLPMEATIFSELKRIIKPGGVLLIGTVDYGTCIWPIIEKIYGFVMPHAYADEHISHYTLDSLTNTLIEHGFSVEDKESIVGGEIIIKCRLRSPIALKDADTCSEFNSRADVPLQEPDLVHS